MALLEIHTNLTERIGEEIIKQSAREDTGNNKIKIEHFSFDLRMVKIYTKLNQMR